MQYRNVCLEGLGYQLPSEIVSSAELEERLGPVYERLRLPAGRLELMSGIRERRFWPAEMMPSEASSTSVARALEAAQLSEGIVGALVHASVCRDYLEPATAAIVHRNVGFSPRCVIYDVSNACLGFLNGMLQLANAIELGQIRAGVVVSTEDSRPLVEATIERLNCDTSLSRQQIKTAVASLTIGSGSVAAVLVHRSLSRTKNRLLSAVARAHTDHVELCRGGARPGTSCEPLLMDTDSERLLVEGVAAAEATWEDFLAASGWSREGISRTFCHQVGIAHRRLMLAQLGLDGVRDASTVEYLGNTGSVALPLTMAIALLQQPPQPSEPMALLGIGSGINVVMAATEWNEARVVGDPVDWDVYGAAREAEAFAS
jgi:3-oxoacyl-[acyl-carrier-protein] synthase-3